MRSWVLAACASAVLSCEARAGTPPPAQAEFGIFFGGQIQERTELPFELEPVKQTQGFRVELADLSTEDSPIDWELTMPSKPDPKRPHERGARTTRGSGVVRAGERSFEQAIRFQPGDPLGLWNIRVVMKGKILIDRPFVVYDADERARASRDAAASK